MTLEWEIFGKVDERTRKQWDKEIFESIPEWMKRMADVSPPPDRCPWDDFKLSKDLS